MDYEYVTELSWNCLLNGISALEQLKEFVFIVKFTKKYN